MKKVLLILFIFSLNACLFDNNSDIIVDDYEVIWIDLVESRSLNKQERLVPAYVFAVGHDSKFIFAKQHPRKPESNEKIDMTITNYYIIERTKNEVQDKPIYGPLSKSGFDSLCFRLGIINSKFDMVYSTNL